MEDRNMFIPVIATVVDGLATQRQGISNLGINLFLLECEGPAAEVMTYFLYFWYVLKRVFAYK